MAEKHEKSMMDNLFGGEYRLYSDVLTAMRRKPILL